MQNPKAATFSKRILAMVIDSLLLLTFTTSLIAILNAILPETQIQPMAMQLMPQKMLQVFFYTMLATTIVISLYVFLPPTPDGEEHLVTALPRSSWSHCRDKMSVGWTARGAFGSPAYGLA